MQEIYGNIKPTLGNIIWCGEKAWVN